MRINKVTNNINNNGINFSGNIYFLNSSGKSELHGLREKFKKELPKLEKLMKNKDYNLYITPNKRNGNLYNIDANKSFNEVAKTPDGRVKVNTNAIGAVVDAAQDAINIFEEHLAYLKNRIKLDKK